MIKKYTVEYAEQEFSNELHFVRHLVLTNKLQSLGYNSIEEALKRCGYVREHIKIMVECSLFDIANKLIEKNIDVSLIELECYDLVEYIQKGKLDYVHYFLISNNGTKWRKLMFDLCNELYVITKKPMMKEVIL